MHHVDDCDDGDPCTIESCGADAACVSRPALGHAAVACVCERGAPAPCADGIPDVVGRRLDRACERIAAAAEAAPGIARRHLTRAATQLGRAERAARLRIADASCAAALAGMLTDGRDRARAAR